MRDESIDRCLVCQHTDCSLRGSVGLYEEIAAGVASGGGTVAVEPYFCFGACPDGPNIVLYPNGTWYSGVQAGDGADIAAHLCGGPPVERLTGHIDLALRNLILEVIDAGLGQFDER